MTDSTRSIDLSITMFGSFSLEVAGRPVELSGSKNQALVSYLFFDRNLVHTRNHLAGLLWPESSEERARQSLRASLYKLRKTLDTALHSDGSEDTKLSDRILSIDKERVAIDPQVIVTSDVADFSGAVTQSELHEHPVDEECSQCQADLERAAELYKGELFAGMALADAAECEEWLVLQREALKNQALRVLDRLVRMHQTAGRHKAAHDRAFQLIAIDRYDEFAHRAVMISLAAQGHRAQAIAHSEICRAAIVDDLGADLDPETVAVLVALRHDDVAAGLAGDSIRASVPSNDADAAIGDANYEPKTLAVQSVLPFHRNDAFVGRQQELQTLASVLVPTDESVDIASAAVLSGIGGIGKTQLAIEFAYRYGPRFPGGVFWVNCSDAGAIAHEIADMGGELGLGLYRSSESLSRGEQINRVLRHWKTGERQLLVFDGCESQDVAAEWLPFFGSVSTLVTSRKSSWPVELPVVEVPVQPLESAASRQLIRKTANHLTDADAGRVAEAVGDHPLALRLAAQFLARLPGLAIDDYAHQLEENSALHESLGQPTDAYSPTADELSIERTFALSYDQLTFDEPACIAARTLLACLLRLPASEPVDKALILEQSVADPADSQALLRSEAGLQRLLDLGLVSTAGDSRVILHRLVADYLNTHARIESVPSGSAIIFTPNWRRAATG